MFKRAMAVCIVVTGVVAMGGAPALDAGPEDWSPQAAASYLDDRMELWWTKAKSLRTGDADTTRCLSCHTAVPYALARPVLRKALGETTATTHETRIVEMARLRTERLGNLQPYYDHTESKKAESRGVEAVLNALILASHDSAAGGPPSAITQKAMARLWEVQRPDGAWDWLDFGLEPYETSDAVFHGATVAALAVGTSAGASTARDAASMAGVERLRSYVRAQQASQRLFNRTWALLASSHLADLLSREEQTAIVGALGARQRPDGGWALVDLGPWQWSKTAAPFAAPGPTDPALLGVSDGYATGLAVYAMKQAGVPASDPSVARGTAWLRTHQETLADGDRTWRAWRSHSLNFDREHGGDKGEAWRRLFMSDLATAFAVLALL